MCVYVLCNPVFVCLSSPQSQSGWNGRILLKDSSVRIRSWREIRHVLGGTPEGDLSAEEEEEEEEEEEKGVHAAFGYAVARQQEKSISVSKETVARRRQEDVSAAEEILQELNYNRK